MKRNDGNGSTPPRLAALGISHSPLKGLLDPADAAADLEHDRCLAGLARRIEAMDPELIVVFAPDHYRGFFNDLMPAFCVGIEAESIGDWKTTPGRIPVPQDIALACTRHLQAEGFDPSFSYRMRVDHGVVQPLDWLGFQLKRPVLPIFVNCWAKPLPPFRRVREFGTAVGRFLRFLDKRVLVIGSGGISHDPPIPMMDTAPPEVRERIIRRREMSPAELDEVMTRVTDAARDMLAGKASGLPPNGAWDLKFLQSIEGPGISSSSRASSPARSNRSIASATASRPSPGTAPTKSARGSPPSPRSSPRAANTRPSASISAWSPSGSRAWGSCSRGPRDDASRFRLEWRPTLHRGRP